MDVAYYLQIFQNAASQLDEQAFADKGLQIRVGTWLDSVVLKIQNPAWLNAGSVRPFQESIFFSVWINDETINQNKLYYNIHALKLRELSAYKIQSRELAGAFRSAFETFQSQWPNVTTQFGPLTLMEGYVALKQDQLETDITYLAKQFIPLAEVVDRLLLEEKSRQSKLIPLPASP